VEGQPHARRDLQHADARPGRVHGDNVLQREGLEDYQVTVRRALDQTKTVMRHRDVLSLRVLRADLRQASDL